MGATGGKETLSEIGEGTLETGEKKSGSEIGEGTLETGAIVT